MTNPLEKSLRAALDDEYKAQATYNVIIQKLGEIRPYYQYRRGGGPSYPGLAGAI